MMPMVLRWPEIEALLPQLDLLPLIEAGYVALSQGRANVPPVGELLFSDPPGDVHIKYGHVAGDPLFVVKVAGGFYHNPDRGLPASTGLMLLFDATTGLPEMVLLDDGHLTNIRTAAAGAVAAKWLARPGAETLGIIGSGIQARLQASWIARTVPIRRILHWARRPEKAAETCTDLRQLGITVEPQPSAEAVAAGADILVTATAATIPLFPAAAVRDGALVIAMGSDTPDKQELDPALLGRAAVVADSRHQCIERGEIHHAVAAGYVEVEHVRELGEVIASGGAAALRFAGNPVVADLTGVAVQDIAIAVAVRDAHLAGAR